MFFARRAIIIVYVIICGIFAFVITLKKRKNPDLSIENEINYFFKAFLFNLMFSLLTTPIVYGIYWLFQKRRNEKRDNYE